MSSPMTMRERNELVRELEEPHHEFGRDAEAGTCLVLREVIRWLRVDGHGDVKLSALDHSLGRKFRVDSVVTVRADRRDQ